MVDVTLIKDTITELLSANVDKETIFATLKDIGVEDGDIEKYYSEITNPKIPTKEESRKTEEPKLANKQEILKPTTTTEELEVATNDVIESEPETKVEPAITKKTENFSFNVTDSVNTEELKKQIIELEEKVSEIKAQINGLTKIMKDILEENRNILNKLK
jgi:hypothetical protein